MSMRVPSRSWQVLFACALLGLTAGACSSTSSSTTSPSSTTPPLFTSDPNSWQLGGENAADFTYASDSTVLVDGAIAARFAEIVANFPNGGTDSTGVTADAAWTSAGSNNAQVSSYIGMRVRMRSKIKTDTVAVGAAIWFRLDSAGQPVTLCNMINPIDSRISGTRDFTDVACVLDIPSGVDAFVFGAMLQGPGTAWFDTATFEQVGQDVPESPHG